jgi:hypothetical protein
VLAAHIWIAAALIPVLDRLLTLSRMVRLLTPPRWLRPYQGVPAEAIGEIVRRRLERPWQMRRRACLRMSLLLYHFLRLAALDAVFHVAVFAPAADRRRLHAHGWVTIGEVCLSEPPRDRAVEVATYGGAGPAKPAEVERVAGEIRTKTSGQM